MKWITSIFAAFVFTLAVFLLPAVTAAQQNQPAEWIRVQSDDGEFSIEVPAKYQFIVDKDGFSISDGAGNYSLKEMKMLSAIQEKTLLGFERYKANKKALDVIRNEDDNNGKSSEIKKGDFRLKQILLKTDKSYAVRQYFNSKNYIYVLTAISRNGETVEMKRFLDSLVFNPSAEKVKTEPNAGAVLFSDLKISPIEIDEKPEPFKENNASKPAAPPVKDDSVSPLVIAFKARPSYTEAARMKGEKGTIRMRITFSHEGRVSKVGILKTLEYGLVRQAFFAALRIKFLPAEKDGIPLTATKVIEYFFDIY